MIFFSYMVSIVFLHILDVRFHYPSYLEGGDNLGSSCRVLFFFTNKGDEAFYFGISSGRLPVCQATEQCAKLK